MLLLVSAHLISEELQPATKNGAIQLADNRHPLYGHIPPRNRLTSRRSFLSIPENNHNNLPGSRETQWQEQWNSIPNNSDLAARGILPSESLAPGDEALGELNIALWKDPMKKKVYRGTHLPRLQY